ncbi:MAG: sensor histidine kinase [Candidatus Acidiferrales bacterium]
MDIATVAPTPPTRRLVLGFSAAAVAMAAATLIAIPASVKGIFSTNFLPHKYCYLYDKQLIALHVGTDTVIWLSYVAISLTLVYLVRRTRREIPFSWMFLAFGLFIVACGFTHLMEVVVLWHPLYWLAGDLKLVTALASIVTAIALPGVVPKIHEMVTAAHVSEERGRRLEHANARLQELSERVMGAQDEERRRIARELHDGIGQYLVAITMSTGLALRKLNAGEGSAPLQDALELLDRCTAEVRTMSYLLHPPLLEEVGLSSAIRWYVEGFTKRSDIRIDLHMADDLARLPQAVELALFRVLQESLTNVHRHAESTVARIDFVVKDGVAKLVVADDGQGFDTAGYPGPVSPGVGITSMRERLRELGGEINVASGAAGTKVTATVPVNGDASASANANPNRAAN